MVDSKPETVQHMEIESGKGGEGVELTSVAASMGWGIPQVKLDSWEPRNEKQWENEGKFIARRNLTASVPNLTCAFGVWLVWSVIVSKIQLMHDKDPDIYPFQDWGSPSKKEYKVILYLLPAIAGLSGGTLRIPNSFMTQVSGDRKSTRLNSVTSRSRMPSSA